MERGSSAGNGKEAGGGSDPRPTANQYLRGILREIDTSLKSPDAWDKQVHSEKARVEAFKFIREVKPRELSTLGGALTRLLKENPDTLALVMGTYAAIRDAYLIEQTIKARQVRTMMGLPTRGRIFRV